MDVISLIKLCQNGDSNAFDTLFKLHSKKAMHSAYLISGSKHLAEEIVQKSFIQCLKSINKLKDPQKFKSWFYRIIVRYSWKAVSKEKYKDFDIAKDDNICSTTEDIFDTLESLVLLGKYDVIRDICPAYETDALVRKINVDRYNDRETVRTNIIESYDQLMDFARKHLPDKFFLEGTERKNLRNIITREMIGNTLIHREFTSAYTAKFVIEKNKMYTENASRSAGDGVITPENMEPNPKNPIIASFFRNIGWSDRLGSGVRNLFKYSKYYSGQEPEIIEGDVFRIIVPLDEEYSFDVTKQKVSGIKDGKISSHMSQNNSSAEEVLLLLLTEKPEIKTKEIQETLDWTSNQVKYYDNK